MCRRKGNYFFGIEGYRIIGNPLPIFLKRVILKSMDIERFSDMIKPMTTWERGSLDQFLQLGSNNFPKELDGGLRRGQAKKKVRWDPGSDLQKLDNWEQKGEEKDREKKEGEEEEEEEDEEANATEEEYSDDSYTQHEYLDDDDEDDFNVDDGGDDGMHSTTSLLDFS